MAQTQILVVEDDFAVATFVCDLLKDDGHDCMCVQSDRAAYQAIPLLSNLGALIVDVNLGSGTTGFDVARFARKAIPDVRVIYLTGQASEEAFQMSGVPDSALLLKPFAPADLIAAVRGWPTAPGTPG